MMVDTINIGQYIDIKISSNNFRVSRYFYIGTELYQRKTGWVGEQGQGLFYRAILLLQNFDQVDIEIHKVDCTEKNGVYLFFLCSNLNFV